MGIVFPLLKSSSVIKKYEGNPILTKDNIPYDATLVFNAGVIKKDGKYYMAFRNDSFDDNRKFISTSMGIAESDDGIKWTARAKPFIDSRDIPGDEIHRYYDPRLTVQ